MRVRLKVAGQDRVLRELPPQLPPSYTVPSSPPPPPSDPHVGDRQLGSPAARRRGRRRRASRVPQPLPPHPGSTPGAPAIRHPSPEPRKPHARAVPCPWSGRSFGRTRQHPARTAGLIPPSGIGPRRHVPARPALPRRPRRALARPLLGHFRRRCVRPLSHRQLPLSRLPCGPAARVPGAKQRRGRRRRWWGRSRSGGRGRGRLWWREQRLSSVGKDPSCRLRGGGRSREWRRWGECGERRRWESGDGRATAAARFTSGAGATSLGPPKTAQLTLICLSAAHPTPPHYTLPHSRSYSNIVSLPLFLPPSS